MALPHDLVFGESFNHHLRQFVLGALQHFSLDFHFKHCAVIKWHGIGGTQLPKRFRMI